jgi:hypothetical protein
MGRLILNKYYIALILPFNFQVKIVAIVLSLIEINLGGSSSYFVTVSYFLRPYVG